LTDGVDKTGVNVIVVSGINPSRKGQTYGGLHNFPRFLEKWNGALLFTGAFIQLNFSNYATSPFDQEALDPVSVKTAPITTVNEGSENIGYYAPPQRRWGYDVGLQFAPAAPAASRFVSPSTTRNEFYSEPKVNDPYISKLCAVAKANPDPNRKESINCPT
jgi:hypothetical protein